jgi:iron complex outermembrane receptor protein
MRIRTRRIGRFFASTCICGAALVSPAFAAAQTDTQSQVGAPSPAHGADQQKAKQKQEGEAIVITGIRGSVESSIARKKNLDVVADVISAEDIGKFPDTNIAESLQRITGVQITRERGEGKFVSVRGLPPEFNLVTLNGHYIANASIDQLTQTSDRRFDFSILAPDFIQTLEVYKSPRADFDEGGVSAIINVRTLQPLDLPNRISLVAEGRYEDNAKKWTPKVSGVLTHKFADGRIGVALGLDYDKRHLQEQSTSTSQLDPITFSAAQIGTGVALQAGKQYYMVDALDRSFYDEVRTRKTATATIQAEPVDNLRLTLEGLYSKHLGVGTTAGFTVRPIYGVSYSGAPVLDASVDENNVVTRLVTSDTAAELGSFYKRDSTDVRSLSGDLTWDDGVTSARVRTAYSKANASLNEIGFDNFVWALLTGTRATGGYDVRSGADIGEIVLPGGIPPVNSFGNNYIGGNILTRDDKSFEIQGDVGRKLNFGFPVSLKGGAKYGDRTRDNNSVFLQDLRVRFSGNPATQDLSQYVTHSPVNDFLNGYDGSALNFTDFPFINPQTYLEKCCGGSLSSWQNEVLNGTGLIGPRENPSLQYTIKERVKAAYAMLDFGDDQTAFFGNVGVRYAHTDEKIDTIGIDLAGIQPSPAPGVPPIIPPAGPFTAKHSYSDVLPSLNVAWRAAGDTFIVRGAIAKVLTRPNLDFLVPRYSVDTSRVPFIITGGNPDLKPYRTWSYDLSAEYYPRRGTILSLALFKKDIDSWIYQGSRQFTVGNNSFIQILPINGKPAHIDGVELNATSVFDFLPGFLSGFGAQANLTYANGHIDADPLANRPQRAFEGLSKWTYNLVLFYEKGPFGIRAAYNSRSPYVSVADLRGQGTQEVRSQRFSTLDLQANYQITRTFSVYATAINVLDEADRSTVTLYSGGTYPLTYSESGRRFALGVRAAF